MMIKTPLIRSSFFGPEETFLSFGDFMKELKLLRLAGTTFGPEEYAQRLADWLSLKIIVTRCNDAEYPLLQAKLVHYKIGGGLFFEPQNFTVWIVVPDSLDLMTQIRVVFHELSHLAAGHPYKHEYLLSEDPFVSSPLIEQRDGGLWYPLSRLARREARSDLQYCEEEANIRTNFAMKAALYGERIYYRDEFFFALKDRKTLPFL